MIIENLDAFQEIVDEKTIAFYLELEQREKNPQESFYVAYAEQTIAGFIKTMLETNSQSMRTARMNQIYYYFNCLITGPMRQVHASMRTYIKDSMTERECLQSIKDILLRYEKMKQAVVSHSEISQVYLYGQALGYLRVKRDQCYKKALSYHENIVNKGNCYEYYIPYTEEENQKQLDLIRKSIEKIDK